MRIFLIFGIAALLLAACKKDDHSRMNCTKSPEQHTGQNGISLNLSQEEWYLTKTDKGGNINLRISGSTDADSVFVTTFGDGLIGFSKVDLDSQKNFTKDVVLLFFATSRPTGNIDCSTDLLLYKDNHVDYITLTACPLNY